MVISEPDVDKFVFSDFPGMVQKLIQKRGKYQDVFFCISYIHIHIIFFLQNFCIIENKSGVRGIMLNE